MTGPSKAARDDGRFCNCASFVRRDWLKIPRLQDPLDGETSAGWIYPPGATNTLGERVFRGLLWCTKSESEIGARTGWGHYIRRQYTTLEINSTFYGYVTCAQAR